MSGRPKRSLSVPARFEKGPPSKVKKTAKAPAKQPRGRKEAGGHDFDAQAGPSTSDNPRKRQQSNVGAGKQLVIMTLTPTLARRLKRSLRSGRRNQSDLSINNRAVHNNHDRAVHNIQQWCLHSHSTEAISTERAHGSTGEDDVLLLNHFKFHFWIFGKEYFIEIKAPVRIIVP